MSKAQGKHLTKKIMEYKQNTNQGIFLKSYLGGSIVIGFSNTHIFMNNIFQSWIWDEILLQPFSIGKCTTYSRKIDYFTHLLQCDVFTLCVCVSVCLSVCLPVSLYDCVPVRLWACVCVCMCLFGVFIWNLCLCVHVYILCVCMTLWTLMTRCKCRDKINVHDIKLWQMKINDHNIFISIIISKPNLPQPIFSTNSFLRNKNTQLKSTLLLYLLH